MNLKALIRRWVGEEPAPAPVYNVSLPPAVLITDMDARRTAILKELKRVTGPDLAKALDCFQELYLIDLSRHAGKPSQQIDADEAGFVLIHGMRALLADLNEEISKGTQALGVTYVGSY